VPLSGAKPAITLLQEIDHGAVVDCFARYGAELVMMPLHAPIPGSFWGEPEAGLIGPRVYARADTPVHSLLHEFCHWICMTEDRRRALSRDAGGDADEECAVCYLQILLAEALPPFDRCKAFDDMDAWGYSFREGSARAWWSGDAGSARTWLFERGIIDEGGRITGLSRVE
jgi:hypothetical protein